ncbi:hypothetical protein BGX34_005775 [Mortierella sp. NVP85]|nr:hypothetical protein BGX34_005775 [Mortierella sp. NVP85]
MDMDTVQTHQDYLNGDQIYSCSDCHAHLGRNVDIISKLHAFEESQKYKEGKYVVEAAKITKENLWIQKE